MSNHDLWKDDITNRFSPASLTDLAVGDGYVATAVIGTVTTVSAWRMSKWDAYLDLRQKLLAGDERPFPRLTTIQRNALTGITQGTPILNINSHRAEYWSGIDWLSVGGPGVITKVAFGEMWQDNNSGDAMDTTNKSWITANEGFMDVHNIITFLNHANGDRLVAGAEAGGHYLVHCNTNFTNAGGNDTTMTIRKNEILNPRLKDSGAGDSSELRPLVIAGFIILSPNDYLDIHIVSDTPSDVVKVYQTNLHIQRVS